MSSDWFNETLYPDHGQRFRVVRELYRNRTDHQDLAILETARFGRMLTLDGVVQVTEGDEFVYHEMLAHVPILAHGRARRVLVIGGGDGGLLRRVLEHPGVEMAVLVEIDRAVIDLCLAHMPSVAGSAFDDPRTRVVIADGRAFVRDSREAFDVILVDSTDPSGPGEALFTAAFYADCKARLASGGVLCTQNGVPWFQPDELRGTMACFRALFADASVFTAAVPTYYGGLMAFGWGTDDPSLRRQPVSVIAERSSAAGLRPLYHTPAVQVASFALPAFIESICEHRG